MAYFFTSIATIYFLIYLFEAIFGGDIFIIATIVKLVLGTIAFKVYLTLWCNYE
jgi:hypothetical protein